MWISIADKTPTENAKVLVVTNEGKMAVAEFMMMGVDDIDLSRCWYAEGAVGGEDREIRGRVTHWQPLPEVPNAN
jgi:hypothetical protein